ncbi:MAG: hypothetical protein LBC97_04125, partial [Bifidobacteriaceae bacterium]|nr:hypothetical protein [Bifidobacteriaceae bacterium]
DDPQALYDRSNADTRRMANQVFFKRLYITERAEGAPPRAVHGVEAALLYPWDEFCDPAVQAEAEQWAAAQPQVLEQSKRGRQIAVQTGNCLNLPRLGCLARRPLNIAPKGFVLYNRWSARVSGWESGGSDWRLEDVRGEVADPNGPSRTFLRAPLVADLACEYVAGGTVRGLARKHGIARSTVRRKLVRAGVEPSQRRLAMSEPLMRTIRSLRDEGWTLRQIADEVGVSHPSVHRLLALGT